jgi:hypothetical protein
MKRILLLTSVLVSAMLFSFNSSAQLQDGSIAPNFTITDLDGNQHELYDYLDQGYTVIIDLYAVWCGPCWNYHNTGTGHPNAGALKELYNQYGPEGTDEVIVMGIESDASTPAGTITGGGNSIGDWTVDVPYIMANDDQIAGLYNLAFYPTVYGICPSRVVTEVGQESVANLYSFSEGCPSATEGTDGGLTASQDAEPIACGDYDLKVGLQNLGTEELTSATIEAVINGNVVASTDWTGSLTTYQVADVEVGTVNVTSDTEVTYNITTSDDLEANNSYTEPINAADLASSTITVKVITDYWSQECSWDIKDGSGNIIDSHQYTANDALETHEHEVNLGSNADCFTFTIYDDYGDGMYYTGAQTTGDPANYGYEIIGSTDDNWIIAEGDGDYEDEDFNGFRIDPAASVSEEDAQTELSIYPNPTNGITNVNFNLAQASNVTFIVYNMVGQQVIAENLGQMQAGEHRDVIDMNDLEPGVYLMNFTIDGEAVTKRITKTR